MNKSFVITGFVAVMLLFAGCINNTIKIKAYQGPERPLNELALLKCPDNRIDVGSVDFNASYRSGPGLGDGICEIGLLPGYHRVEVETPFSIHPKFIGFEAEAGKVYLIKYEVNNKIWRAWISEAAPGKKMK